ncbi:hypothetical protein JMUB6875_41920 [Nocardia sp. JMUB6875]
MNGVRSVGELADADDPAWPALQKDLAAAEVPVEVLPGDPAHARQVLYRLQVTARSTLGALSLHTGGLVVDTDGCASSAAGTRNYRIWRR